MFVEVEINIFVLNTNEKINFFVEFHRKLQITKC